MAEYYLIAQLPSLDGLGEGANIPITEEYFFELCNRFLPKKTVTYIENITLSPQINFEKSTSTVINEWNENESRFRIALAKVRAERMNKTFNVDNNSIPAEFIKVASEALEQENPLQAEKFLLNFRLNMLESIRPIDNFSNEYILYYALKLKLLIRIRKFDEKQGKDEYTKIYNSILSKGGLEVEK